MRTWLSVFASLWLILFGSASDASGQYWRNHEFHIEPTSLHINEHVPEPILYYYSDTAGHIFRTRANDRDVFLVSDFPLGTIRSYHFKTPALGWVCGENGFLSTSDSGRTWQPVDTLTTTGINWQQVYLCKFTNKLFALSSTTGLWSSDDDGRTWSQVMEGAYGGMVFHGNNGILLAHEDGLSYFSRDGGRSWDTSEVSQRGGKPCYYAKREIFVAANPADSSLYISPDGDEWQKFTTLKTAIYGDIFSDCMQVFIPGRHKGINGYNHGDLEGAIAFTNTCVNDYRAYCFSRNSYYCYLQGPDIYKYMMGSASYGRSLELRMVSDLYFYVPRCSTLVKEVTIALTPIDSGTANVIIRPLSTSPHIQLISDPTLISSNRITFKFAVSGDTKPQSASYVVEAERCGVRELQFTIYTNPRINTTELQAKGVNFGKIGTCNTTTRWMQLYNPDCDTMEVLNTTLTAGWEHYTVLPGQLPLKIGPKQWDSIRVRFDPESTGSTPGAVAIDYRTFDGPRKTIAYLNGSGSSGASALLLIDTVSFGRVSACSTSMASTSVQNTGCESLQLEDVRLRANSRYVIASAPIGAWLMADSALRIDLEARVDQVGQFSEDLEVVLLASNGVRITRFVTLRSEVTPAITDYALTHAENVGGLTICNTVDTLITITNLSTCTDMLVSGISIAHPAIALLDNFSPFTLKPQETAKFRVRISGAGQNSITDQAMISTDLFGVVAATISAETATPVLTHFTLEPPQQGFITTQCEPVSRAFAITTEGCGFLPVNDIRIESNGATKFSIGPTSVTLPIDLMEPGSIDFDILYDPESVGSDAAELVIEGRDGEILSRTALSGQTIDKRMTVGLDMIVRSASPLTTDQELEIDIIATDDVEAARGLTSIETELQLDTDLFTLVDTRSANGVSTAIGNNSGGHSIRFSSSSGLSFAKGDVLASLNFRPAVTSRTSSEITMTGLILNDDDPQFKRCNISPANVQSTSSATITLDCVERVVNEAMNDRMPFEIVSVYPQPADSREQVIIELTSLNDAAIAVSVVDLLGREHWQNSAQWVAGQQRFTLPLLPSGIYHVRMKHRFGADVRAIIIR